MVVRDYTKIQIVLFDLDGTILIGLGPYESSLEQAVKDVFGINIQVDLSSFHGLTDREILYRTLQQTNFLKLPARNQNPEFEKKMNSCLRRFGEVYQADATQTKVLPNVEDTLYSMNIEGGPCVHTSVITGNTEEMARKKLALFERNNEIEDEDKDLRYQGLNFYFSLGAFGNQSYYRENLVALVLKEIEKEKTERESRAQTIRYAQDMNLFERAKKEYHSKCYQEECSLNAFIWRLTRRRSGRAPRQFDKPKIPEIEKVEYPVRDIYVVGDTTHDIFAGLKTRDFYSGKIFTVGVLTGRGTREQLQEAGADYVIEDISELREIILNQAIEYNIC